MPGHSVPLPEALPRSHFFLTVSRGTVMRTFAVRSLLVYAVLATCVPAILCGTASLLYVLFHDDLMAGMMARQSAMQFAYEERIQGLRDDLDHQSAQGRATQNGFDAKIKELLTREARLETRAVLVAGLAAHAGSRPSRATEGLPAEIIGRPAPLPAGALGFVSADKPRVLDDPTAEEPAPRPGERAGLPDDPSIPVALRLSAAEASLERVEHDQTGALARMGAAARDRIARASAAIEEAGLSPERFLGRGATRTTEGGVGGPFVPLPESADGAFGRAVADLRGTMSTAIQLGEALTRIPLAMPLGSRIDVTSPFGARTDPFLGRPALHTGVDLRDAYGSDIRATGAGRVTFASQMGGYGNMVEVAHGNGLVTRYAHMGRIDVVEGQVVARGTVVGIVGATGRATGPHLHYEVRIDGEPVDPMRFLASASRSGSREGDLR